MFIYNADLARKVGVEAALVYGALQGMNQDTPQEDRVSIENDLFFYAPNELLEVETALNAYQIRKALKTLEAHNLIKAIRIKDRFPAVRVVKMLGLAPLAELLQDKGAAQQ